MRYVNTDNQVCYGDRVKFLRELTPTEIALHKKYGTISVSLETLRNAKLAEINAGYSTVMAYIQAGYPAEEILSWERQATQATELLTNPNADAVFVRVLASQKQITVTEMRDRILSNATNWEPIAALLTAQRQVMEESAYMAQTIADVENIKVGYSV